jgi:hypothetical protein
MKDGDIIRIAHVVRNIDAAMRFKWETFGLGPRNICTFDKNSVRDQMLRGRPPTSSTSWRWRAGHFQG